MAQEMKSGRGTVLKSNFEVSSTIDAFYTGGKVQFSHNEDHLFCTCNDKVQVLHVESGKVVQTLREEGDVVSCFAASPDDEFVVTASKSLLLRQWDWKNGQQLRTWKAVHRAPIASMVFDSTSTLLATGSSDSTVKVWDIIKQYYTHNFTGSQGVVSLVCFHPDPKRLQLFSTSDDCKIRIWDLKSSRCAAVLESHFSVVTSLAFSHSGETMISSSRDNVLNVWDLTERRLLKTIPAFEGVESVIMLPKGVVCPGCEEQEKEYFMTAGSKGKLRVWSVESGKCVFTQPVLHIKESDSTESNATEDSLLIVHAALCETLGMVAVVTFDHNVVLHELETLKKTKQFVGYNDEILDLCFAGVEESHLAVATNSSQLRMYNLSTMNCQLLEGHTDIVLTLDINTAGDMLVTGSKDNTIRIWQMSEKNEFRCVAVGKGHTHAVATVAWSRLTNSFVASGSQDCTIKIWSVPQTSEDDLGSPVKLSVRLTEKAHEKDINSVTVSPNDKLLASGSQDKTAKIWIIADGSLLGTLRGHKKGIWCVRFSPVDQCVATSSADSTVKIWALSDLTCVKTFEGHTSSVLRVTFVTKGMQLISSGSEGLLKLWTIKTNECVQTFDQHLDKVWSITVDKSQDRLVSGGADSVINIWKDVTEIEQEQAQAAVEENIMKQQKLSNLIADKKYVEAISLAITLEQPFRVMGIMKDILCVENGTEDLTTAVKSMRQDQLDTILRFLVEWNTNSKNCHVAQTVLSIILKTVSPYELKNRPNMKGTIEALIPYSEKHFQRMNRLLQQMEFIEYTWQSMRLSGPLLGASQTVGLATQATSTSDTDTEARHTTTADNFPELGTSSQNPVSPSSPDPSPTMASPDLPHTNGNGKAGSDSEESDTKQNNVDQNRASDLEIEETCSPGLNGEDLFELNREDEEMREDVEKKNRKTKKTMESEVASLLKKKAKLKKLKQGNVKRKIKTGADKTVKIKRKTRTS